MMLQQDFEAIVVERAHAWNKEVVNHALRVHIPHNRASWQRWVGQGLVLFGAWLMRRGQVLTTNREMRRIAVSN